MLLMDAVQNEDSLRLKGCINSIAGSDQFKVTLEADSTKGALLEVWINFADEISLQVFCTAHNIPVIDRRNKGAL